MTTWLQTLWDWRFPKRYYLSICLKGLQSYRLTNFFVFQKLYISFYVSYFHMKTAPPINTFDFLKYYFIDRWKEICNFWKMKKVWQPATLQPLEAHEQVVPFWNPPISKCLDQKVVSTYSFWYSIRGGLRFRSITWSCLACSSETVNGERTFTALFKGA